MENAFLVILVVVILFFIIRKIVKKLKSQEAQKAWEAEQRTQKEEQRKLNEKYKIEMAAEKKRKQEELPTIIEEANATVDKYEKRIAAGQDKYQIGRTLYEIKVRYAEEFGHRLYSDNPPSDRQNIENFYKRITDICDTDILLERGYKDEEQQAEKQQKKAAIEREKEKAKEIEREKAQAIAAKTKKEEYITKTFVGGTKASVEMLVNNYVNTHKDYVLVFKAPIEQSVLGTHSTTITMKKIK